MQKIAWKVALVLVILVVCAWSLYPPEQKMRLGRDLQGGTSLIYLVTIPEGVGDKAGVLAQTITVLKDRINPTGVLDISMQPLGIDRIEIVMPLPNEQVLALRKQYIDALAELTRMAQVRPIDLDEALRFHRAVEAFGAGSPERAKQIEALQSAYNDWQAKQKELDDAKTAGAPSDQLTQLEQDVAQAELAFGDLRDAALKTNLEQARVSRALALSNKREIKHDDLDKPVLDKNGVEVTTDSPRAVALASLKSEFPHLSAQIDKTIAAFDTYQSKRVALDDPEDLMRLLRGAGVLEFRIAVRPNNPEGVSIEQMKEQLKQAGPNNTDSTVARWFPINDPKQWTKDKPSALAAMETNPEGFFANRGLVGAKYEGQFYLLLYITRNASMTHDADTQWTVESTGVAQDQIGRPAVSFHLDNTGGNLMNRLTGQHLQQPMAIVLDGQVYSAPNINSQIGKSGIIEGDFSKPELDYLTRVLAAGALSARLSDHPIAINTLGPSIGADNLHSGLKACFWSIIAVSLFMMIYYFQAGLVAIIAMGANAIMIFGVMALIQGTFTLPGLAGIALTLCTAVDANILIYERIREELATGEVDLRGAIRLGYKRAMSTILDANVTNLIVCVALMKTATTEVKGFALTLMIGILGTLFCALFMTRLIYTIATDIFGMKRMPMLATTVPAVRRFLEPNLNWIGLRKFFIPLSAGLVLISLILIGARGTAIFDTEFRGGMSATMHTAFVAPGERKMLKQTDVKERVRAIGHRADSNPPSEEREVLREMRDADVLTVGETHLENGAITASGFQVKVSSPPNVSETGTYKDIVVKAIVNEFGPELDVTRPLQFTGVGSADHINHTFRITSDVLGKVINRPQYTQLVGNDKGGVAIVVDNITPPTGIEDIIERVKKMRSQPDFQDAAERHVDVIPLEPAEPGNLASGFKSVAILVSDPQLNYAKVGFEQWDTHLAKREWQLVSDALARPAALEQVSEFSPAVATTLRANAAVAVALSLLGILVYIWIRFGSLRYSAGAVIALLHDAAIGVGAVALSQLIGETAFGKALLIQPFHIELSVVAAVLTLMGYSLNDTIVVLDRIRENRGKLQFPTAETVNRSINQTFSRTTLTSLTIFISLIIMYVVGGTGIRAFSYVMLVGMLVGTYSSIAIAAPMVFKGHDDSAPKKKVATETRQLEAQPAPV